MSISGNLVCEISDLQQFTPNGKFYRIKGNKGVRLNMEEFKLFLHYASTKLTGAWQKSNESTHVFGDYFAQMQPNGVRLRKYYVRENQVLPGIPNMFFSHKQWQNLMISLPRMKQLSFGCAHARPCFQNKDTHYDTPDPSIDGDIGREPIFVGCAACVPFLQ